MTDLAARPNLHETSAAEPIRAGIIGASGYGGGELVRLLERHPRIKVAGLQARGRSDEPIAVSHPHLAGTGHAIQGDLPQDVDVVFLAMPHGAAAQVVPELVERGCAVVDLGPDFRLRQPSDYPAWYGFDHPHPELLDRAVYGLPELHRDALHELRDADVRIVAAPGCYPTTTLLALAPLARAGLIADLVVDAKSGVSGAGREPKAEMHFSEVNESLRAYGVGGHRHVAEIEQELAVLGGREDRNPGIHAVDFLPHLVPMTRGILASCHVRPTRAVTQSQLDQLYADAYADEPFVHVVPDPPATKNVLGSNFVRIHVRADERTGRVLVLAVLDNLVKGAAGQAVQAANIIFGLPETLGLEQLPLNP